MHAAAVACDKPVLASAARQGRYALSTQTKEMGCGVHDSPNPKYRNYINQHFCMFESFAIALAL